VGIMDFIKGELVDVIEWKADGNDALVYRFPDRDADIKMGAQLTVREGQAAILVKDGQIADVFTPGRYELETRNMPLLTTLMSWKHGFESPFKVDVYFVRTTRVTDQKWGTPNSITKRDAEFGMVRLRAFGSYTYRVADPGKFLMEIVGTDGNFGPEEINGQLRACILTAFSDALGESNIPMIDLVANYKELGSTIGDEMTGELAAYGLELTKFLISNISLPPELEKVLDKRIGMGMIGNDMGKFTQYQAANAMEAAAANPGGGASEGIGMGAGLAMGQAMAAAMGGGMNPPQAAPAAPSGNDLASRLGKLKTLLDGGLISQEDFDAKKAEILAEI